LCSIPIAVSVRSRLGFKSNIDPRDAQPLPIECRPSSPFALAPVL
jgi:hypothetical protein